MQSLFDSLQPDAYMQDKPSKGVSAVSYAHLEYDAASLAQLKNIKGWIYTRGAVQPLLSVEALSSDDLWFTNLNWIEYQAIIGASRPHIKSEKFLPIPLSQMRKELGIDTSSDEEFACALIALADNLMRLCAYTYGDDFIKHISTEPTFAQAIAKVLGMADTPPYPANDALHESIIWTALQEKTILNNRAEVDGESVACFRMAMKGHASRIMQCPLPNDSQPWIEVTVEDHELDEFFAQDDLPAIIQIKRLVLPELLAKIYPTHLVGKYNRKDVWLPSIEVKFLRTFGLVEIGRVFVQKAGYLASSPWSERMPSVHRVLELSYSAQLMMHGHLIAASIPLSESYWPLRSFWVTAMDRMLMAIGLFPLQHIEGIEIISYGEGAASIRGPKQAISRAIELAPKFGMLPTQSAWRAASKRMSAETLKSPEWIPAEMSPHEKLAYQLTVYDFSLTLKIDDACMLALHDEQLASQTIQEIMLKG